MHENAGPSSNAASLYSEQFLHAYAAVRDNSTYGLFMNIPLRCLNKTLAYL